MRALEEKQRIEFMEQQLLELSRQNAEMSARNEVLTATVESLTATIAELQETIRELRRQLGQNSRNSSKPPSSDGYRKPSPKSQRTKSGRKQGGQKGHTGSHMELPHEPDEVIQHLPEECHACPRLAGCISQGRVFACREKRYVVDVVVTTKVTEHRKMEVSVCPMVERGLSGQFPEKVRAYVQYGDSVSVLAGLLNTYGAMSVMRIHVLLGSLMGVRLSTGAILSMVSKCARRLCWVHSSSTAKYTHQTVSAKRGQIGMEENGVLPEFSGTAVHDCWAPYWKYDEVSHAVCNAHLLRELTGIEECYPEHTWATSMKSLLLVMKKVREKAQFEGRTELSQHHLRKFDDAYDSVMQKAELECPEPPDLPVKKKGRKKRGKERSLIERLIQLKESVCLFVRDFRVPFDNNQAERDVRNVKTKAKVSGCFRTPEGAQNYLDVMSYLSTGKKHGISVFEALTAAFSGNAEIVLQ